jgi:hypothetical protein
MFIWSAFVVRLTAVALRAGLALLSIVDDAMFVALVLDCKFMFADCPAWLLAVVPEAPVVDVSVLVDALLLVDALPLVDALLLVDALRFADGLALVDVPASVEALSLRQSLSAVPSFPTHAAGIVDDVLAAAVDAGAEPYCVVPIDCAPATLAAAIAVATSTIRGLNSEFN